MRRFFYAWDNELDIFITGYGPPGLVLSGLIQTVTRWDNLGIKVTCHYDPESSPPQLISRIVEYD